MDKPKIKKRLGGSPYRADAFFMTFYHGTDLGDNIGRHREKESRQVDRYSAI